MSRRATSCTSPPRGFGFAPAVSAVSLYVAPASDFSMLNQREELPTPDEYRRRRDELIADDPAATRARSTPC